MLGNLNERVKKLDVVDIELIKASSLFAAIILVKLFPKFLEINFITLVVLTVATAARPFYKAWIKKA